jgi:hypothetical protein
VQEYGYLDALIAYFSRELDRIDQAIFALERMAMADTRRRARRAPRDFAARARGQKAWCRHGACADNAGSLPANPKRL